MVASEDDSLSNNIIEFDKTNLLKSIAIYGPNASGKTNILRALPYVASLIMNSHENQPGEAIDFRPFKLDKKTENSPSVFEIVFEIDGIKYTYGFSVDQSKVYKEYLYYYPRGRKRRIFVRDLDDPKIYTFPVDEIRQNVIKENTRENMLYLSRSANMNYEKTSIVVKWFSDKIRTILRDSYLLGLDTYTKKVCDESDDIKTLIMKSYISKADSGIVDIKIKEKEIGEDFLKDAPKEIRDIIIKQERRDVETIHHGLDKEGNKIAIAFNLSEESKGTRKLFSWAGPFVDVLKNGRLLLIDEFERSLHPLLVRYLLSMFNDPEYNKKGAQLIIATHSPYLLHPDILRRDQVWLTDKNSDQGTELRSLYEYRVRKYENIEKGYLAGRYGSIPNLD
jgi:hypothetical protein